MALEAGATGSVHQPPVVSHLALHTDLTRPTVRKCLRSLAAAGWHAASPAEGTTSPRGSRLDGSVSFSADVLKELLASEELTPTEKLLYAILATQSRRAPRGFALPQGSFTYRSLSRLTGWDPRTVRTAVRTLANQGWLGLSQENRRQPIHFTLQDPHTAESLGELARMQDRLLNAKFRGEALMREYLSLIVASDHYEDNASPGFLVNPMTGEHLQLDRYYPPRVAFEFNGRQHYVPTERFPEEVVARQKTRDLIKIGICARYGIDLRTVHAEDLSLPRMREKVGDSLPLRDLSRERPRIEFLESQARLYRRAAGEQEAPLPL